MRPRWKFWRSRSIRRGWRGSAAGRGYSAGVRLPAAPRRLGRGLSRRAPVGLGGLLHRCSRAAARFGDRRRSRRPLAALALHEAAVPRLRRGRRRASEWEPRLPRRASGPERLTWRARSLPRRAARARGWPSLRGLLSGWVRQSRTWRLTRCAASSTATPPTAEQGRELLRVRSVYRHLKARPTRSPRHGAPRLPGARQAALVELQHDGMAATPEPPAPPPLSAWRRRAV